MNNIIWLASYPKSGNTWCRSIISSLLDPNADKVKINQLQTDGLCSGRESFDLQTIIKSADLTYDEIDLIRPDLYKYQSNIAKKKLFIKVHDAYTYIPPTGYIEVETPLFPKLASHGVVYILRNPLDIAISYAAHDNLSIDQIITTMNNPSHKLSSKINGVYLQFRQQLLNWSQHVLSWCNQTEIPLLIIRYEDLQNNGIETVTRIAKFCELDCDQQAIEMSLKKSDFKILQQQESELGFIGKPQLMKNFFRSGKSDNWQKELSNQQIEQILKDHGEVMQRFGYLNR